ncbi:Fc.00g056440.m01.CDS01 [Cosmosporella sp. VM-42]
MFWDKERHAIEDTLQSSRSNALKISSRAEMEEDYLTTTQPLDVCYYPNFGSCAAGPDLSSNNASTDAPGITLIDTTVPIDPLLAIANRGSSLEPPTSTPVQQAEAMEKTELCHSDAEASEQSELVPEKEYPVDRLLGRWGKDLFYLRWLDGSYGWEPRENILDDELIRQFEKGYKGFHEGVNVLRTRIRNGKVEYRVRWMGRPSSEDWWVAGRELSPELIEKHKPRKKGQKRKRS